MIFSVGDFLVFSDDGRDSFFGVICWLFHFAGLEVVDETDNETVAVVVFGLVPSNKFGFQEVVYLVVVTFGVTDKIGACDKENEANYDEGGAVGGFFAAREFEGEFFV